MSKKTDAVLSLIYDVWISGTKLDMTKKACIESVEVKETVDKSDSATIRVNDPTFSYIEDDIFVQDNPIKIRLGWSNTTYRVNFDGYISALDISFPESGVPVLIMTCMDNTHVMNREKKSDTFSNMTRADVVKKIVTSYGYTCVVDESYEFTVEETITQSDQTDIDFIQKLAGEEVYPFTARLVGNTFYYVKKGTLGKSVMTLTYLKYPHDIISFDAKVNKESKKVKITKAKIDTGNKTVTDSTGESNTGKGSATQDSKDKSGYTYDPATGVWTQKKSKGSGGGSSTSLAKSTSNRNMVAL